MYTYLLSKFYKKIISRGPSAPLTDPQRSADPSLGNTGLCHLANSGGLLLMGFLKSPGVLELRGLFSP